MFCVGGATPVSYQSTGIYNRPTCILLSIRSARVGHVLVFLSSESRPVVFRTHSSSREVSGIAVDAIGSTGRSSPLEGFLRRVGLDSSLLVFLTSFTDGLYC